MKTEQQSFPMQAQEQIPVAEEFAEPVAVKEIDLSKPEIPLEDLTQSEQEKLEGLLPKLEESKIGLSMYEAFEITTQMAGKSCDYVKESEA
jgi:hypothetical protein